MCDSSRGRRSRARRSGSSCSGPSAVPVGSTGKFSTPMPSCAIAGPRRRRRRQPDVDARRRDHARRDRSDARGGARVREADRDRSRGPAAVRRDLVATGHRDPGRRRRRRDHHLRHRRSRRRAQARRRAVAAQLRHRRDHEPRQRARVGVAAVEAMLGYPAEEMVGRCTVDLVHPDDVDAVVSRFLAVADDASCRRRSSCGCGVPTASTSGSSARSRTGSTIPTCAASC